MLRSAILILLFVPATALAPAAQAVTALDKLGGFFSDSQEILDPDRAFVMSAAVSPSNPREITVSWDIADGYYLYRDKFGFSSGATEVTLGAVRMPAGEFINDPQFGKVEIYRHAAVINLGLHRRPTAQTTLTLNVAYQGCKEDTVCYPPISKSIPVLLPAMADSSGTAAAGTMTGTRFSAEDAINHDLRQNKIWWNLGVFLGFGLLLALTPCVFPMLPILSGIIVGHGATLTTRRAFNLSLAYVLAMALTYAILGVIAGAMQFNLQAAAQNVWVLSLISAVFVLLALSMFGFFELQLPTAWQEKLSTYGIRHQGSMTGAVIMGAMSAVIVGPCLAPPLAGALLYINQTGNATTGGAALFAMGMGIGLPLLVIGTSAGRLLPRAGAWMETIKRIFGVVMLGVAIWFLERVLAPPVALLLWGVLVTVTAVYIGAFDRLAPGATWRKLWKGLGIIMLVYGISMIIGAANGGGDKLRPLGGLGLATGTVTHGLSFNRIKTGDDLDRFLEQASLQHRTVMLDFYADWCITCKEMEKYTFSDPAVREQLQKVLLLQADVTANDAMDQALLKRFDLFGPPAILFFADGEELRNLRVIGFMRAADFTKHISMALSP